MPKTKEAAASGAVTTEPSFFAETDPSQLREKMEKYVNDTIKAGEVAIQKMVRDINAMLDSVEYAPGLIQFFDLILTKPSGSASLDGQRWDWCLAAVNLYTQSFAAQNNKVELKHLQAVHQHLIWAYENNCEKLMLLAQHTPNASNAQNQLQLSLFLASEPRVNPTDGERFDYYLRAAKIANRYVPNLYWLYVIVEQLGQCATAFMPPAILLQFMQDDYPYDPVLYGVLSHIILCTQYGGKGLTPAQQQSLAVTGLCGSYHQYMNLTQTPEPAFLKQILGKPLQHILEEKISFFLEQLGKLKLVPSQITTTALGQHKIALKFTDGVLQGMPKPANSVCTLRRPPEAVASQAAPVRMLMQHCDELPPPYPRRLWSQPAGTAVSSPPSSYSLEN